MKRTIRDKMIIQIVPAVFMVLVLSTAFSLVMTYAVQKKLSYVSTMETTRRYANEFDVQMRGNLTIGQTTAVLMQTYTGMNRYEILNFLHQILITKPHLAGTYVGCEPNAFDGQDARYSMTPGHDRSGRFLPYWNRLQGKESLDPLLNMDTSDWYTLPKNTMTDQILEPLLYEGVLMTSFVSPIIKNRKFIGIAGVDVTLGNLDKIVSSIRVFDTGYAFLVSKSGIFVSYPDKKMIGTMTLSRLGDKAGNPALARIVTDIQAGKEGTLSTQDPVSGRKVVMFYTPVKSCTWGMVLVAPVEEIFAHVKRLIKLMALLGIISTGIITTIVILVASSLAKPIVVLSQTANQVANGNLDINIPIGEGEIGILGMAFNNMAGQLKEMFIDLENNVTELKEARNNQEKLITELEARNIELARFTYTVSHDLKSPLITIKGFLGYLGKDVFERNTERMESDMMRIAKAADTMSLLLDELLELSRIGRLMNPSEELPFTDLAKDAAAMVEGRLSQRGVVLEIMPDMPVVFGDRPRLREVVENLIDNAVKFMGDQTEPKITIGTRNDKNETVFFVRDNGIGIDPRYHEKVFGLFEKLNQAAEGTGMGLSIIKRIIEIHNGRIWVESEGSGKGTTFCFTLPRGHDLTDKEE